MKLALDSFPKMAGFHNAQAAPNLGDWYIRVFPTQQSKFPYCSILEIPLYLAQGGYQRYHRATMFPQGNTILVELRLSIISTIGQSLKPCH
jgi:hypothetical protein